MRFLGWPGRAHLLEAWGLSLLNAAWFVLVYGGCDRLTALRALRVPVHVPAELAIPLVPWTIVLYMSIYLLFVLGPFVLRERTEFRALIGTLASIILVAGICFLLFPSSLAFPSPTEAQLGIWAPLFGFADRANLTYNLAPSLHVAVSVACVAAFAHHAGKLGKTLLWAWAAAIAVSTVLTHQHHLLDVASGWLLAILAPHGYPLLNEAASTRRRAQVESAPDQERKPMKTRILSVLLLLGALAGLVACAETDAGITTKVKSKFAADDLVKAHQIDVTTEGGVVTLTGNVDSLEAKDRALTLARETKGVTDVRDMISARSETGAGTAPDLDRSGETVVDDAGITLDVKTKLLSDDLVKGLKIDVDTRAGVVYLTGNVGSEAERDQAVKLARESSGVKDVQANLTIGGK